MFHILRILALLVSIPSTLLFASSMIEVFDSSVISQKWAHYLRELELERAPFISTNKKSHATTYVSDFCAMKDPILFDAPENNIFFFLKTPTICFGCGYIANVDQNSDSVIELYLGDSFKNMFRNKRKMKTTLTAIIDHLVELSKVPRVSFYFMPIVIGPRLPQNIHLLHNHRFFASLLCECGFRCEGPKGLIVQMHKNTEFRVG